MHLITETGELVLPGHVLTAVAGPHAGRRFRFAGIHADGKRVLVHHTSPHPFRNARTVLHPSVFACILREEVTRLKHLVNLCHHTWQRLDEWLLAGAVALVPLAFFEQYHLAERITHALTGGE